MKQSTTNPVTGIKTSNYHYFSYHIEANKSDSLNDTQSKHYKPAKKSIPTDLFDTVPKWQGVEDK